MKLFNWWPWGAEARRRQEAKKPVVYVVASRFRFASYVHERFSENPESKVRYVHVHPSRPDKLRGRRLGPRDRFVFACDPDEVSQEFWDCKLVLEQTRLSA